MINQFSGIQTRTSLRKSIALLLAASASATLFGYTEGDGTSGNPYILTSSDSSLSGGYYFEATSSLTVGTVIQLSNGTSPQTNYLYVRTNGITLTCQGMRVSYLDGNTAYVYVSNGTTIDGSAGSITTGFRGTGTLDISGASTVKAGTSASFIGYHPNAIGTVNVKSGSTYSNLGGLVLGYTSSATGHLNVDGAGSTASSTYLTLGENGTGTVSLNNGGSLVSTSTSILGRYTGASGTITISSGSHWNNAGLTVAAAASSTGSISVEGTGSYVKDTGAFNVGSGGTGTATIADGALVAVAGMLITGTSGVIQLNDGYFALKSASLLTPSSITSSYHFKVFDGSSYVTGTDSNIQTEYFSTSTDWQNSALYSTYSSLDLTGYTLVYQGSVPEPATFAFIGGFAALGFVALRRRRK